MMNSKLKKLVQQIIIIQKGGLLITWWGKEGDSMKSHLLSGFLSALIDFAQELTNKRLQKFAIEGENEFFTFHNVHLVVAIQCKNQKTANLLWRRIAAQHANLLEGVPELAHLLAQVEALRDDFACIVETILTACFEHRRFLRRRTL